MTPSQIASVVVSLAVLLAAAHVVGHLFERLRQPRLVGEIVAGALLGPHVLGRIAPGASSALLGTGATPEAAATRTVVAFAYWLGLLLLMFVSGSEVRRVLATENRRPTAWILGVGTPLPFFLTLAVGSFLPLRAIAGPAGSETAVLLVLGIAVAVTSIPVISRIFQELRILHTRFASLVLGAALVEDVALWAALAVATALAAGGVEEGAATGILGHVGTTVAWMAGGLWGAPVLLRRLHGARWNVLRAASPVGYAVLVLFVYAAVAALLGVNLVFAAFLAGFGLVGGTRGTHRRLFAEQLDAIAKVAFAVFVPIYFAVVGAQLQLGAGFSLPLLATFLLGSSAIRLISVGLSARLAGFRGLEIANLAVAFNARGGPGIVLASVAYEAGIIRGAFFTTLVLTAILTSQFAGTWLRYVLGRGRPLLREDAMDVVPPGDEGRDLTPAWAPAGDAAAPDPARTEGGDER